MKEKKLPSKKWFKEQVLYCPELDKIYLTKTKRKQAREIMKERIQRKCPICGFYHEVIYLDARIANAIMTFNEKEYRTKYSCSGHPDSRCLPYIYFDLKISDSILRVFDNLPLSWYVDVSDLKEGRLIIRSESPSDINGYPEYLDDLEAFSHEVPYLRKYWGY